MSNEEKMTQVEGSDGKALIVPPVTPPPNTIPMFRGFQRQRFKEKFEPYQRLIEIFSWKRPHNSEADHDFVHRFLDSIGCEHDAMGNRFIQVGKDRSTMFSCHTDTVHHIGGYQRLSIFRDKNKEHHIGVVRGDGNCLGGDDGTGVWLCLEMIKAKKPGLYVFHRGEEKGCIGSTWIAQKNPDFLKGIQRAIAFDRRDYDHVITHQGGKRGCSQTFANALSTQLGLDYKPDPSGLYTDTAQYFGLVPECTNISVGYSGAHGPAETQNLTFALALRESVLKLRPERLPVLRDPGVVEFRSYGNNHYTPVNNNNSTGASGYGNNNFRRRDGFADRNSAPPATVVARREIIGGSLSEEERHKLTPSQVAKQVSIRQDMALSSLELIRKYPFHVSRILLNKNILDADILLEVYGQDFYNHIN
jgi:hypothetical protein